jgi:hypothetical protein
MFHRNANVAIALNTRVANSGSSAEEDDNSISSPAPLSNFRNSSPSSRRIISRGIRCSLEIQSSAMSEVRLT